MVRGKKNMKAASNHKRKEKTSSLGGSESEGRESEEKDLKAGLRNVVVRFAGEGRVRKVDPLK